jgi:hypothetical protein
MPEAKAPEEAARAGLGIGTLRPGSVTVITKAGVPLKSLHEIITRVVSIHGCNTCGLGGIDFRIVPEEEFVAEKTSGIEGIRTVVVGR